MTGDHEDAASVGPDSTTPTMDGSANEHPFFTYLCTALSPLLTSPLAPASLPLASYNGPTSWKTKTIQRNLSTLLTRMKAAEDTLRSKGIEIPRISQTERIADAAPTSNGTNSPTTSTERAPAPVSDSPYFPDPIRASVYTRPTFASLASQAGPISAPASLRVDHAVCSHCGAPVTKDSIGRSKIRSPASPLLVPSDGPLATAAKEGGLSAMDELQLLKKQVQDVARVCNAVATGDLSQKITVEVHSDVMNNLKAAINTMVRRDHIVRDAS